jgi:hypothetical protein
VATALSLTGGIGADAFVFHPATPTTTRRCDGLQHRLGRQAPIHDLLIRWSGSIADWARISDSGGNSIVEVDRDGTGGTHGWTQIAALWASLD